MSSKRNSARNGSWLVLAVGFTLGGLGLLGMWLEMRGLLPEPMTRPPAFLLVAGASLVLYALVALLTKRDGLTGKRVGADEGNRQ